MAKSSKGGSPAEPGAADSFTERIARQIEKDYGEGILVSGLDHMESDLITIPFSPSLDCICGGIQEASWMGITGPPKHGKTSLVLSLAAKAQRPEYGGRPVYYAKIEGRLSPLLLKGTAGLQLEDEKFTIIQSYPGRVLTSQDYLSILSDILRSVPGAYVIIDSISALCDEKEMTDGVGTETRGGGAKLFSQFCRTMNQVVPVNKSIVVGITHLIANTSGMGPPLVERAAKMWSYQCDYQFRVKSKTPWKIGERQIGLQLNVACNNSKLCAPGMNMDTYVRFGTGIDYLYEAIHLGVSTGLVKKSGPWLALDYLRDRPDIWAGDKVPQFQGIEKVHQALQGQPQWAEILQTEVVRMGTGNSGGEE